VTPRWCYSGKRYPAPGAYNRENLINNQHAEPAIIGQKDDALLINKKRDDPAPDKSEPVNLYGVMSD
jgi:hypothetical protein